MGWWIRRNWPILVC